MGKLSQEYVKQDTRQSGFYEWCRIGEFYHKDFDDEDREWFDELLLDATQTTSYIAVHLKKAGLLVSDTTLGRHRRKVCRCNVSTEPGL